MSTHHKDQPRSPSQISVTNELFSDYLNCEQKLYLRFHGTRECISDYIELQNHLTQSYREQARLHFLKTVEADRGASPLKAFSDVAHNHLSIAANVWSAAPPFETIIDGVFAENEHNTESGLPCYAPVLFVRYQNIHQTDRLLLAYSSWVLSKQQHYLPEYGLIIHGPTFRHSKVGLANLYETVTRKLLKLQQITSTDNAPPICLNKHCAICEFEHHCYAVARKDDNLSLLRGLTPKNIAKLNKKGIFTVTQYSYTFRPRRKRIRQNGFPRRWHPELKALAIRENKVYVYETPSVPEASVKIYFDVEGIPERGSYYLIGVLLDRNDQIEEKYFWADNESEEIAIFRQFISLVSEYPDAIILHFGNYDRQYIKRMAHKVDAGERNNIDNVLERCCNILRYFYSYIYVPTYSNSLKEIGAYLGFQWSKQEASGIQSMVWRTTWQESKSVEVKENLIQYNKDDCYALVYAHSFIESVIAKDAEQSLDTGLDIAYCQDIKPTSVFRPGIASPEVERIIECSYFDYQRRRVFVRSDNYFRDLEKERRKKKRHRNTLRTNEVVICISSLCPQCKSKKISRSDEVVSKKVLDLKFSKRGMKKWVVRYDAYKYRCRSCRYTYLPGEYKSVRNSYGHHLRCWVLYNKIVNNQSDRQIELNLEELFGIGVTFHTIKRVLKYFADYYRAGLSRLFTRVLSSDVLYVDETPIKTKYGEAWVWVFTNNVGVVSVYKKTREGSFLPELLSGFKGVLVTDFFSAYDQLSCKKQRCLIHLIRDLNDDILSNPFDDEFHKLTSGFTKLLQSVVETIDRHGLKAQYLYRHRVEARTFLEYIIEEEYSSEVSRKYQARFIRYKEELFEFLNNDNVAWNNSIAEHAVRLLELHTNRNIWFCQEETIKDYLVMASIYQTCRYNEMGFLEFLLSGKVDTI